MMFFVGSWNGEIVEELIRVVFDYVMMWITELICSVLQLVDVGGVLFLLFVMFVGFFYMVGEVLGFIWDVYELDNEVNFMSCLGGTCCVVDLVGYFILVFFEELVCRDVD